jgi:hypothetical protein
MTDEELQRDEHLVHDDGQRAALIGTGAALAFGAGGVLIFSSWGRKTVEI